jgi:hypothetical protein
MSKSMAISTPQPSTNGRFEGSTASCEFARERLGQSGEAGREQRQERPGNEFGGSTAATGIGWPVVRRFDELDRVVIDKRDEQAHHPLGRERGDVTVAPHHEVAVRGEERSPQSVPLAVADAVGVVDGTDVDHGCSCRAGNRRRVVGRAVVENDELVDKGNRLDELLACARHQGADRRGFVTTREAQRDGSPSFGGHDPLGGPRRCVDGAHGMSAHRTHSRLMVAR